MDEPIVLAALFSWPLVILALFSVLPARRATLTAFLFAWLFLPVAGLKFAAGIPLYDKMSATCAGVMLAAFMFDSRRIASFRPSLIDLPMAVWCLCPFVSSISNDLGPYDGLAAAFGQTVTWGMPYFVGRVYFRDLEGLRELAIGMFIGGLVYVPLCLLEIKMSPQLHNWVYGFQQHSFIQTYRLGGWRPTVFMSHGIMVSTWMCMTGLIGVWLWHARVLTRLRGFPVILGVLALLGTAIMCKSIGAIILLALGCGVLFAVHGLQRRGIVWGLVALAPLYMLARGSGTWDGSMLIDTVQSAVQTERADSLEFRMKNEDLLAAKALQRPIFGWGGWGRNRVLDKNGVDVSITDGLWIITLGVNGGVGLIAWTLAMLLPATAVLVRFRVTSWRNPRIGSAIVLAVVTVLYVMDCIPNAMSNPIFTLCIGGLASLAIQPVDSAKPVRSIRRALAPKFASVEA